MSSNIFPVVEHVISKESKERFLIQQARVIWFTGLSGSGKSSIAIGLEKKLNELGYLTQLLDGDNVRTGICSDLTFSPDDRMENIRRVAEVSKLFVHSGIVCINCFISPTEKIRLLAKSIIGQANFIEIFIDTPLEICEARDPKGLYKKARAGLIKEFTGIDAPYENPINPSLIINTLDQSISECVDQCFNHIEKHIQLA